MCVIFLWLLKVKCVISVHQIQYDLGIIPINSMYILYTTGKRVKSLASPKYYYFDIKKSGFMIYLSFTHIQHFTCITVVFSFLYMTQVRGWWDVMKLKLFIHAPHHWRKGTVELIHWPQKVLDIWTHLTTFYSSPILKEMFD